MMRSDEHITDSKYLTMSEVMDLLNIKSRATFYKKIVPLEKKQRNPEKYRGFIGYKDINDNGRYAVRRFPRKEVEAFLGVTRIPLK